MAVNLSPVFGVAGQLFDDNGNPLAGGKIYTYLAGTTTNAATFTNAAGNIAHSNPIVLDGAGRVPSGEIWLTDGISYKFVVEDSASALIGTFDDLVGINSNFVNFTNKQELQTATAGQTVFNLTTMQYAPGTNNLTVFVDGVNQYGPGAQYAYVETDSDTVTFVSGLHVGASVKFTTSQLNTSGGIDAEQVSYNPPFVDAVSTNVEAKLAQTVSVKDFGAVGDGVTNDAAAIQAAIDYVFSANGGEVYVPFGTYICSSTITLKNNVKIYGDGPKVSILEFTSATGNGITLPLNLTKSSIEGLKLYASSSSTGNGISYIDTSDASRELFLDQYEIEGFKIGIRLAFAINAYIGQGRLIGQGAGVATGIGIHMGDPGVIGCYATTISKAYIAAYETGYYDERPGNTLALNIVIEGCNFPVVATSDSYSSTITMVAPYFEGNNISNALVNVVDPEVHMTIINPFAYDVSNVVPNFSARLSGTNITLLGATGQPDENAPSLLVRKGGDEAIQRMECYSDNFGHVPSFRMVKSHQDTQGNTATIDGEYLGQFLVSGVNSSSSQAITSEILSRQVGAAGATYIKSEVALRVGSSTAARSDAVVANQGASGEMSILIQRNNAGSFTLERVKVGAADSGGVGYRALVINN